MFYPRPAWGARKARPGPGRLNRDDVIGLALHWPGMSQPLRNTEAVKAALRGWQDYHMDAKDWSDIAYQVAVDQAGNVYRLRGLRNQSGANGDTDVNELYGAALLVLAPGEHPTPAMITAVRRVVRRHRRYFPNSRSILPHSAIRNGGTDCPGDLVRTLIANGTLEPR